MVLIPYLKQFVNIYLFFMPARQNQIKPLFDAAVGTLLVMRFLRRVAKTPHNARKLPALIVPFVHVCVFPEIILLTLAAIIFAMHFLFKKIAGCQKATAGANYTTQKPLSRIKLWINPAGEKPKSNFQKKMEP